MRFRDLRLNAQKRQDATRFVAKMLKIDNAIIIYVSSNNNYDWVFWKHDFIKNNTQTNLIKTIYFNFFKNFSNANYFNERVILIVTNVNVNQINIVCVNTMQNNIHFKYNSNKTINSFLKKKFFFECFHRYDKFFLFFHVFRLKINMFFMLFRNFDFFVQCNDTRIKLTRIFEHILKTKIINNKSKD